MVLLCQCKNVLQGARHHDGLMRVGVERKPCKGTAGLHSQSTLVGANFTCNFDEYMNALVAAETDEKKGIYHERNDARNHWLNDHFITAHASDCDAGQEFNVQVRAALETAKIVSTSRPHRRS
jgi:hypothetical protein